MALRVSIKVARVLKAAVMVPHVRNRAAVMAPHVRKAAVMVRVRKVARVPVALVLRVAVRVPAVLAHVPVVDVLVALRAVVPDLRRNCS